MYKPSIITRARAALQVFQRGYPSRSNWGAETKKIPYIWPAWRENTPTWTTWDLGRYVEEGFTLNSVIYTAIMYKAWASGDAPLRGYTGETDHPELLPTKHYLQQLCMRPNKAMSWRALQMVNTIFLNISGNSYCYLDRPSMKAPPVAMWPLRPDRVYIVPGAGGIKGYAYLPEGKSIHDAFPILPVDMIHIKFPNPADPFEGMGYGLSPLTPMAKSADVDNMITSYINLFFRNGAMPPGYISFKGSMEGGDMQKAKERWMEVYGGYENWSEIAVLDNEGEYKKAGMTFDEMGFESLDNRNEERMSGPFGVPAALLGLRYGLENSGIQANIEELRRNWWEDRMIPEMSLHLDEISYHLNTETGEFVLYDFGQIPALQRNLPPLIQAAKTMWDMGTPANVAFQTLQIPVEEVPGGDLGYLPLSVLPIGSTPAPEQSQVGQPTATEEMALPETFARALVKAVDRIIETYPKEKPRP